MIELTVALPLFNSGKIAWLALEGLCNQRDIDFEWELVIAEEQNDLMFGKEGILEYKERLERIGCVNITYLYLIRWISLGEKWRLIAINTNANSKAFLLQASDCYSQPFRLKAVYQAIVKSDFDWYKSNQGLFYHLKTKKNILFSDVENIQRGGLNMATLTKYVKNLPLEQRRAVVDGWLYKYCNPKKVFVDIADYWELGVDTHGLNQISLKRDKFFRNPTFPFVETELNCRTLLPEYIIQKFDDLLF